MLSTTSHHRKYIVLGFAFPLKFKREWRNRRSTQREGLSLRSVGGWGRSLRYLGWTVSWGGWWEPPPPSPPGPAPGRSWTPSCPSPPRWSDPFDWLSWWPGAGVCKHRKFEDSSIIDMSAISSYCIISIFFSFLLKQSDSWPTISFKVLWLCQSKSYFYKRLCFKCGSCLYKALWMPFVLAECYINKCALYWWNSLWRRPKMCLLCSAVQDRFWKNISLYFSSPRHRPHKWSLEGKCVEDEPGNDEQHRTGDWKRTWCGCEARSQSGYSTHSAAKCTFLWCTYIIFSIYL